MLKLEDSQPTPKKTVDTGVHERSSESDSASILEEQRKINLAREGLYAFLARSFKFEVDSEFLTMVAAVQPVLERLASSQSGTELKKASELLSTTSSEAAILEGKERKQLLLDLAIEFSNLFINPGQQVGRERVMPWESAYFTSPPRMYGPPYHKVVEAFRLVNFEKPKEYNEPEDHIALELEFMAHLARLTTASIDSGKPEFAMGYLKLQKEFLADHLLTWVGKFSKELMKNSEKREVNFYYALAMMLESYIKLDDQTVDLVTAELKQISGGDEESSESNVGDDSPAFTS
jgi:putative dimethyl sulfoxide reductase chaperone